VIKWIKRQWRILRVKRDLKQIQDTLNALPNTSQPITFSGSLQAQDTNLITLSNNKEEIFSIDANGNAHWHNEATYDEVAEVFLNVISWKIENEAGIRESRMDWEKKITEAIIREAENNGGTLDTEQLTNVVKKCIMYDRLKGFEDL